ncbi:Panacea domain-containing protein [Bacillus badius]|uniref:Panacea domain-containing protein n=1 Tax=Bacillus badius TaxID=1455 RepID=UPI0005971782|nr:type II toxin-antitoxin system antitoxin SocA domain-containing protein [Bacillus badius]KIL72565.1 hypothetical protein SD78_4150 [Bacillus badius]
MSRSASDFAKYFIKNKYDYPRNTFDGNMKLQKMLYFSQLIHLTLQDEKLFEDDMYAFKNGTVIENIRQQYQFNHEATVQGALQYEPEFTEEEKRSLEIAEKIFGHLDAKTLSDLNHQQHSWITSYENSKDEISDFHHKELSIIDEDVIKSYDLATIQEVINAYFTDDDDDESFEIVNGVTFYYDPETVQIDSEVLDILESFKGEESVYSLCYDENNGYIIF